MATENPKMEGTQMPTKIPSSLLPVNHNVTEYKNERNANITG